MTSIDNNQNNGLITKIWGPPLWKALHSISFGYPIEPSDKQKEEYKRFFTLIGDTLPCRYCRDSYKEFISTDNTILNESVMKNRDTLSRWLYDIHNRVNKKLDVTYDITYEKIKKDYESYRAKCNKTIKAKGCLTPLNLKAESYKNASMKDCPIIQKHIVEKFIDHAIQRGIHEKYIKMCKKLNPDNKQSKLWEMRNKICANIINKMRIKGIESIIVDKNNNETLSDYELKLVLLYSTNLPNTKLQELSNNIKSDNYNWLGNSI